MVTAQKLLSIPSAPATAQTDTHAAKDLILSKENEIAFLQKQFQKNNLAP
jgi:hypothetical protein